MKEATLTRRILKELNNVMYCRAVKYHGGRFSQSGEPDIHGSYRGRAFFIEVKVGKNQLTKLQAHVLDRWRLTGAYVEVARETFTTNDFINRLWKDKTCRSQAHLNILRECITR